LCRKGTLRKVVRRMIDVDKLIDDYLAREVEEREIGVYYPSEIGFCMRRNYYLYTIPKQYEASTLRVFKAGELGHLFVGEVLKQSLEEVKLEYPIILTSLEKDWTIRGRLDSFIIFRVEDEVIVVELKTVSNLYYIQQSNEAHWEHVLQIMPYLKAVKARRGIIVYVDRRNLRTKYFEVQWDEAIYKHFLRRVDDLHNYLVNKKLPLAEAKLINSKNWMCKYCNYSEECEKNIF